jgi:hypothetical protein
MDPMCDVPGSHGSSLNEDEPRKKLCAWEDTEARAFVEEGLHTGGNSGRVPGSSLRIFETMLAYGKRIPEYEADGRVTLRIFDGSFDERTAALVARWRGEGREIGLDGLLILSFLRENAFIDKLSAATLLQLTRDHARAVLDRLAQPGTGFLERKGGTKAATFHLTKGVARDLFGKAAYPNPGPGPHALFGDGQSLRRRPWLHHTAGVPGAPGAWGVPVGEGGGFEILEELVGGGRFSPPRGKGSQDLLLPSGRALAIGVIPAGCFVPGL